MRRSLVGGRTRGEASDGGRQRRGMGGEHRLGDVEGGQRQRLTARSIRRDHDRNQPVARDHQRAQQTTIDGRIEGSRRRAGERRTDEGQQQDAKHEETQAHGGQAFAPFRVSCVT